MEKSLKAVNANHCHPCQVCQWLRYRLAPVITEPGAIWWFNGPSSHNYFSYLIFLLLLYTHKDCLKVSSNVYLILRRQYWSNGDNLRRFLPERKIFCGLHLTLGSASFRHNWCTCISTRRFCTPQQNSAIGHYREPVNFNPYHQNRVAYYPFQWYSPISPSVSRCSFPRRFHHLGTHFLIAPSVYISSPSSWIITLTALKCDVLHYVPCTISYYLLHFTRHSAFMNL